MTYEVEPRDDGEPPCVRIVVVSMLSYRAEDYLALCLSPTRPACEEFLVVVRYRPAIAEEIEER